MELLKFLNKYPHDWQKRLTAKPYYLEIRESLPYYCIKYRMLESDFSLPEVLQARGLVVRENNGEWIVISYAMDKFFNATEQYAETKNINWSTARVQAKIDGSLIKIAFDPIENEWLCSSNGAARATEASTAFGKSFYEVFCEILGSRENVFKDFCLCLDKNYTYFFELISKYNKICVSYDEDAIYYLGRRNMLTFKEDNYIPNFKNFNIKHPHEYQLSSYEDCKHAIEELGENQEGFVVCDDNFRRIKMKTPWYIAMHRLRGNGVVTPIHILSLWQSEAIDDFLAAFPEYNQMVNEIAQKLKNLIEKTDIAYEIVRHNNKRKDFAINATKYIKPIQSYLFARLDNKVDCAQTYFKQMKAKNLADLIEVKEIGLK